LFGKLRFVTTGESAPVGDSFHSEPEPGLGNGVPLKMLTK
jgi:hypothetical protein